ncbi:MAG: hypothetical protein JWN88_2372 [Frankiales bacterium]|nr:hypothetical protein [Frankiales bacterium]
MTPPPPAPTTTTIDLPDTWAYGPGVLHGGWLLETVTAAAMQHTTHPHPLAVSGHFVAGPKIGPAELDIEPLREGRSVGSLRARLHQEGRPKLEVLVTAGTLPGAGSTALHLDAAPPSLPLPEHCTQSGATQTGGRNGVTEQLEVRLDPVTAGWVSGRPGGSSESAGWIRPVDGRPVDPLMLITLADALPPVSFDLGIAGWVPTIELTVHLRCLPAQGWMRVMHRTRLVQAGWLDEECEIWDSTGQLVAQARQLAGYREPAT